MPKHDLKMNKKADIKIPTETLVGIIVFIVVLLGIFVPLFIGAYNFFFGSKVSELSINNFDRISAEIGNAVNAEGNVNASLVISFDESIRIAAFNYDCNTNQDPDCPQIKEKVYLIKPKKCGISEACICYYGKSDGNFEKALSCASYGKNTVFSADVNSEISSAYSGDFSTAKDFIMEPEADSGTSKISIEKTESNGVTKIFFFVEGKMIKYAEA